MIELNCGNCAWMRKVGPPKGEKKPKVGRGYCTFNPPAVYPFPGQKSKIAQMGKEEPSIIPYMLRPVVEENEPACGRYNPDAETFEKLQERAPEEEELCKGGCGGCKNEGAKCEC